MKFYSLLLTLVKEGGEMKKRNKDDNSHEYSEA